MTHPYRAADAPPTKPRPIVRRDNAAGAIRWLGRLFIVPHVTVGLGMVVTLAVSLVNPVFGHDDSATVTAEKVTSSQSKGRTYYHYEVAYSYNEGGVRVDDSQVISLGERRSPSTRFAVGGTVLVRHVAVGPFHDSALLLAGDSPFYKVLPIAIFTLFWNGLLTVFLYHLWYLPLLAHWLYRHGDIGRGQVVRRFERKGKGTSYHVDFSFESTDGRVASSSMLVSSEALHRSVTEGQPVTVLYDPRKLSRSVVYECGDYRWPDDTPR